MRPLIGKTIEDGEYQNVYYAPENQAIGAEGSDNGANIEFRQTFDVK